MGIGVSIFLIALGAVLAFAVNMTVSGLDINTVGFILMLVGTIGLVTTLILLNGRGGGWYGGPRRTVVEDDYIDDEPVLASRRRVTRRRDVI